MSRRKQTKWQPKPGPDGLLSVDDLLNYPVDETNDEIVSSQNSASTPNNPVQPEEEEQTDDTPPLDEIFETEDKNERKEGEVRGFLEELFDDMFKPGVSRGLEVWLGRVFLSLSCLCLAWALLLPSRNAHARPHLYALAALALALFLALKWLLGEVREAQAKQKEGEKGSQTTPQSGDSIDSQRPTPNPTHESSQQQKKND
jgi:hypothetical protein